VSLLIGGTLAYLFLPAPWWIVVVILLAGFELLEVWFWLWLRRRRPRAGHEAMVGLYGTLAEDGRVRIRGTTYPARALDGGPGDAVVVEAIDGMTLVVRRGEKRYQEEAG